MTIIALKKEEKETIYVGGRFRKHSLPFIFRHKLNIKRVLLGLTPNQMLHYFHPDMDFTHAQEKGWTITQDNRI